MNNRIMRVTGIQMLVRHNVSENEERIIVGIKRAADDGSDFLVTPEGSLSGYWAGFDSREVADALERVTSEAKKVGVGLALGTCFRENEDSGEVCYNQVRIYSRNGDYLGFHAKILRCSPINEPGTIEMADYAEKPLRTFDWNGIRFGALICNDMWATPGCTIIPNPYLAWNLKQMGADLILHAINSGTVQFYRPYHESNVSLWARTLGMHIVEVNAAGENGEPGNVRSGVVGPDGEYLIGVPYEGEHSFTYDIELPPQI
ncbi:MAG: carbon-nitrogen hydrolase family protein [Armatimonadota bacterium]